MNSILPLPCMTKATQQYSNVQNIYSIEAGGIRGEREKGQTEPDGRSAGLLENSEGAEQNQYPGAAQRLSKSTPAETSVSGQSKCPSSTQLRHHPPWKGNMEARVCVIWRECAIISVYINMYIHLNNYYLSRYSTYILFEPSIIHILKYKINKFFTNF